MAIWDIFSNQAINETVNATMHNVTIAELESTVTGLSITVIVLFFIILVIGIVFFTNLFLGNYISDLFVRLRPSILQQHQDTISGQESQIANLKHRERTLNMSLSDNYDKISKLKSELTSQEKLNNSLKKSIYDLQKDNQELKDSIKDIEDRYVSLLSERDKLKEEVETFRSQPEDEEEDTDKEEFDIGGWE